MQSGAATMRFWVAENERKIDKTPHFFGAVVFCSVRSTDHDGPHSGSYLLSSLLVSIIGLAAPEDTSKHHEGANRCVAQSGRTRIPSLGKDESDQRVCLGIFHQIVRPDHRINNAQNNTLSQSASANGYCGYGRNGACVR